MRGTLIIKLSGGNLKDDTLEDERSKKTFSIDVEVIKGIQAQIASVAQRDEMKKG